MDLRQYVETFDKAAVALLQAEERAERLNFPLYHYTDAKGLEGMFCNKEIWFSDFRHLNDPEEFRHGLKVARALIEKLAKESDVSPAQKLFMEVLWDALEPERLFNTDNDPDKNEYFVACFSRSPDELGQWRAYAADGRGYAVGFDPKVFQVAEPTSNLDNYLLVGRVRYQNSEIEGRHEAAILAASNQCEAAISDNPLLLEQPGILTEFLHELVRHLFATALIWNCITSKHSAYAHEREVRMILMSQRLKLMPFIETRVSGSDFIPFVRYPLASMKTGAVRSITGGPASPADFERTVGTFLDWQKVFPPVRLARSKIPYRPR